MKLRKGSPEAKAYMASIRSKRGKMKPDLAPKAVYAERIRVLEDARNHGKYEDAAGAAILVAERDAMFKRWQRADNPAPGPYDLAYADEKIRQNPTLLKTTSHRSRDKIERALGFPHGQHPKYYYSLQHREAGQGLVYVPDEKAEECLRITGIRRAKKGMDVHECWGGNPGECEWCHEPSTKRRRYKGGSLPICDECLEAGQQAMCSTCGQDILEGEAATIGEDRMDCGRCSGKSTRHPNPVLKWRKGSPRMTAWLEWNDHNGDYRYDSKSGEPPLTDEEMAGFIANQIEGSLKPGETYLDAIRDPRAPRLTAAEEEMVLRALGETHRPKWFQNPGGRRLSVVECGGCGFHWHPKTAKRADEMVCESCPECGSERYLTDNPEDRETCRICQGRGQNPSSLYSLLTSRHAGAREWDDRKLAAARTATIRQAIGQLRGMYGAHAEYSAPIAELRRRGPAGRRANPGGGNAPLSRKLDFEKAIINGENISIGDNVAWMSGGTWKGTVVGIEPYFSSAYGRQRHNMDIMAYGEIVHLKGVEDYGLRKIPAGRRANPDARSSRSFWITDFDYEGREVTMNTPYGKLTLSGIRNPEEFLHARGDEAIAAAIRNSGDRMSASLGQWPRDEQKGPPGWRGVNPLTRKEAVQVRGRGRAALQWAEVYGQRGEDDERHYAAGQAGAYFNVADDFSGRQENPPRWTATRLFPSGGWEFSTIVNGYYFHRRYFDFTKKEAARMFMQEVRQEEGGGRKSNPSVPHADRENYFSVASGLYWFANDYHGGQTSVLYSILSARLKYEPGQMENGIDPEDYDAQEVYDYLEGLANAKRWGMVDDEAERLLDEIEQAYQETR